MMECKFFTSAWMDVRHDGAPVGIKQKQISWLKVAFFPAKILDKICFTEAIHVTTASDSTSTHSFCTRAAAVAP